MLLAILTFNWQMLLPVIFVILFLHLPQADGCGGDLMYKILNCLMG